MLKYPAGHVSPGSLTFYASCTDPPVLASIIKNLVVTKYVYSLMIYSSIIHKILSVAGSDYVAGSLQATFPTNSIEGESSCVDIDILQDMVLEGDHSFSVVVTSATPSVVMVGMPSEETVTILDDESMYVRRLILFTHLTKRLQS